VRPIGTPLPIATSRQPSINRLSRRARWARVERPRAPSRRRHVTYTHRAQPQRINRYDSAMPTEWVLLSYRLPREPSTPRIATWRKLKRLGVAQLNDGLVALPDDARTREQLEWLAGEIAEAGGVATTWLARPGVIQVGRDLVAELTRARVEEYQAIIAEAKSAAELGDSARRAVKRRLLAELHRIGRRDYFPTAERTQAHDAVAAIVDS